MVSKYKNIKTVIGDISFDSRKEASHWQLLKLRERAKEISDLQRQVRFKLIVEGVLICTYVSDFSYVENESAVIVDVKSEFTRKLPVYRIKKKLMKAVWKIDVVEV